MISLKFFTEVKGRLSGGKNIAESFNHSSRVHERYRQSSTPDRQTDDRRICDRKYPNIAWLA